MADQPDGPPVDADQERPRRRGRHTVAVSAALVGVVVVVLVAVLATRPAALEVVPFTPLLGRAAPEVAGPDVNGGPPFRLSSQRGRWAVVNYFATWCVPCRKEHPQFVAFRRRHPVDVALVMVVYNDDVAKVRQWFSSNGGDWPVVTDPGGQTALDYGVRGVPETFIVDPNGVIVSKVVGGITADGLDRGLAAARAAGA